MSELIISVSGLRGVVGDGLNPLVAARYVAAYVQGLPDGPIVVTRDGRTTGAMLADAVHSTLAAMGRTVLDGGIAATPTTGVLVRHTRAAGGIQISASHNPPEYNGIKLFSWDGRVIDAEAGERVLRQYESDHLEWADYQRIGTRSQIPDTLSAHAALVLDTVDIERIRARKYRVLLDSNHGAGSLLGRYLLTELGCELTHLGATPDGMFEHPAEPTEQNLAGVTAEVTRVQADVGFCQDPDADRLAVIDESGRYIGEEYTLAICLGHVLKQHPGPVVTNCASSRMSQDLAEQHGVPFHRSPVGEANVTGLMKQTEAQFGGEGNGGPIDPRVGYVRDSFVGMALILDAMAARGATISELAAELPAYAIYKTKFTVVGKRIEDVLDRLEKRFADAQADRMDGLRLDWPGRWLLVRASNTEPIVRAIAEAETAEDAKRLCEQAGEVIG
jgi:phosphomannomutase